MNLKVDNDAVVAAYNDGQSMNAIAKAFGIYATTVRRILEQNNIELRHDTKRNGSLYVQNGEKLIEWAKAQGRLVTKAELASVAGTKRLSPSYFLKYPELGQYVKSNSQKETNIYVKQLYDLLQKSGILYKPHDRSKLGVYVDALLLGDYSGLAVQINIKPSCLSNKNYAKRIEMIKEQAKKANVTVVFLDEHAFTDENLIKAHIVAGLITDLKNAILEEREL